MTTDKESSAGDDVAPLQPTPRVDKIALRHEGHPLGHNDAVAQYNDLLDLARKLEHDLIFVQARFTADKIYTAGVEDVIVAERKVHQQDLTIAIKKMELYRADLAEANTQCLEWQQTAMDCKATLADERYCHGQTVMQLKQAASEEIKAANERASSAEYTLAQLTEQVAIVRHNILDGCGSLKSVLDSDQTNAVLSEFDLIYDAFPTP